ncbi:hypothetical protein P9112_003886 [Eukaryota sp. TZLM1-RC]
MFGSLSQRTPVRRSTTQTIGYLRLQKDVGELDQLDCKDVTWDWPDAKNKPMEFNVTISPRNGIFAGGVFPFSFKVSSDYPHKAPEVRCLRKIYHPNIDLEGHVCLNILREDYRPVLTITSIIHGLRFLFTEPNPNDPLNRDAAEDMVRSMDSFKNNVKRSMRGERVGNERFDRVLQ